MTDIAQATATVTITDEMIDAGAEQLALNWSRSGVTMPWEECDERRRDVYRHDAHSVLLAALAAAPPPAPSEETDTLDQAVSAIEAPGFLWDMDVTRPNGKPQYSVQAYTSWESAVWGKACPTLREAIRSALALAAGRSAEEGA